MGKQKAKKLIVISAGGNARVILDTLYTRRETLNEALEIMGFLDDDISKQKMNGVCRIGNLSDIEKYAEDEDVEFVDAIGNNILRKQLYDRYNFVKWYTVIHPSVIISPFAEVGEGSIIMPGAIINSGSRIGKKCLINTGVIVEHDNIIGDFSHLASGTATAGNVQVGECTLIGTGARIKLGTRIGNNCTIGAGAVVVSDIPENCTAVGVPAKVIE